MIRLEATYKNGNFKGESGVRIEIDVDASQLPEVAQLMLLKAQQQLRLQANWGRGTREMGMVSYDGKRDWGKDGSFTVYFVSDNSSVDFLEWGELMRSCAGKKNKDRKTFFLTCLTLEESQEFDRKMRVNFEKSVLVVDQQNEG